MSEYVKCYGKHYWYVAWSIDWIERLRKFEEEEQMKKVAAEQAAEQAAEMNAEMTDDAQQLFDKPRMYWRCRSLPVLIYMSIIVKIIGTLGRAE